MAFILFTFVVIRFSCIYNIIWKVNAIFLSISRLLILIYQKSEIYTRFLFFFD
jgi:hypothetical protein